MDFAIPVYGSALSSFFSLSNTSVQIPGSCTNTVVMALVIISQGSFYPSSKLFAAVERCSRSWELV